MESKQKQKLSVQFDDKEQYFSTDSTDELENDDAVSVTENQTVNISRTSSALRSGGDVNSVSSISTGILDDVEDVKVLKEKLAEADVKINTLECETEKLRNNLLNEKSRSAKLEKKLQFVKDNQEVFMRLKEAYINMKYNEAAGRKMIEIREKGVQTWEGILCRGCLEAEDMRRQIEGIRLAYQDSFIVAPFEMDQLTNTIKYLKDLIERREKSWSVTVDRESKMQSFLKIIESENSTLKNLLKNRQMNLGEHGTDDSISTNDPSVSSSEVAQLKKIIIKFEKRFREMQKNHQGVLTLAPSLNEKERRTVDQLMVKYNARSQGKSREKLTSRSVSAEGNSRPGSRSAYSSSRGAQCEERVFKSDNKKENTTILMIDNLFQTE